MRYQYNCVNPRSLDELEHIIEQREDITLNEFKNHVNFGDFQMVVTGLGYHAGFPIEDDQYVQYCRSEKPNGEPVYFLVHSAIEYIFYH